VARELHGGGDHSSLMPRTDEVETWERLDHLLSDVQSSEGLKRCDLVAAHTATLLSNIESAPALDTWPLVSGTSTVSARWVETVLGIEIDRLILRMLENPDGCVDCLVVWVRHLIEARITVSKWAWARDAGTLLG
jgi:hypothetical protein